jgi:hypothetical protein
MNRPYRCAATIHPVRYFPKWCFLYNIRALTHDLQEPDCYLTGQGCSATPQMDFLRDHQFFFGKRGSVTPSTPTKPRIVRKILCGPR